MVLMWRCYLEYDATKQFLKKLFQKGKKSGLQNKRKSPQTCKRRISAYEHFFRILTTALDSPGVGDSFCQRDNRSISNIERLFS
jgi:hypothetical protein